MNKVKMFFVASALVLTTAGVFAGKAKFIGSTPENLYYRNPTTSTYGVLSSSTFDNANWEYGTANGSQLTFKNAAGSVTYGLYSLHVATGVYSPIYAGF